MHMLGIIIRVVEMDDPFFVSLHDLLGQKQAVCDILADGAGHIVALYAVDDGVLVGIFLHDLLVVALNQAQDLLIRAVRLTNQGSLVTVCNIVVGYLVGRVAHNLLLDHILDLLHARRPVQLVALCRHPAHDLLDLPFIQTLGLLHGFDGLLNGILDFFGVEGHLYTAALNNIHSALHSYILYIFSPFKTTFSIIQDIRQNATPK